MKKEIKINRGRGLINAAELDDVYAVKYWVEVKHTPITRTNVKKQTAAHIAVGHKNLDIIKYLLGKDNENLLITVKDINGFNILQAAAYEGATDIIKYLLEEDLPNIDAFEPVAKPPKNNILHLAAQNGHLDALKYLIEEKKGNVNVQNDLKETPLLLAVQKQHFNIVRFLVSECNADLNSTDSGGNTPLHVASGKGDLTLIEYLMDDRRIQFDVNSRNNYGETCLHKAVTFNHTSLAEYWISQKKADVNLGDIMKKTPLYQAAFLGHVYLVKYLVEHGADTEIANSMGKRPIDSTICVPVISYLKKISHKRNRRRALYKLHRQSQPKILTQVHSWPLENVNDMLTVFAPLKELPRLSFQSNVGYHW